MLKEIINKIRNRDSKWKELREDDRLQNKLQERKIPHNERVLNNLLEEERQESIKEALDETVRVRKLQERQREREMMKFNPEFFSDTDNILKQPNIFKGGNNFW